MKTNIAAKINALWEPHKWTLLRSQTGGGIGCVVIVPLRDTVRRRYAHLVRCLDDYWFDNL